ncbi:ABC transporter substrate-binding protein [Acidimangrovimonas sediminis]|uniref:ABC transporter substrate-binding protein n=1 Tax=Acidimangrovimonas sediminis TaxID=2056283 RepID=UPI000C801820|nr:ABC transporter substrate-binding protein [Acidimangrovimonas sediminis]
MWGFARASDLIAVAVLAALSPVGGAALGDPAGRVALGDAGLRVSLADAGVRVSLADTGGGAVRSDTGGGVPAPARVVSINLCTDQLAMGLAAPGQLLSVSWLAADPRSSAMAAEAGRYRLNRRQAEEVYLMRPDLVLAGTFSDPAALALLRRLGLRVETFAPVTSLRGVRAAVLRMGRLLGREGAARAEVEKMDVALARLTPPKGLPEKTAALYYPNGYSPGGGTLANAILAAAGFRNLAARTGRTGAGTLPLERLVMAAPSVIVTSHPYPGASRAEAILRHPALREVEKTAKVVYSGPSWVCGTPEVVKAVAQMAAVR